MYLIFSVPDGDYMNVSVQLEEDFLPICFVNVAVPFSKLIR